MIAVAESIALVGMDGHPVDVEVSVAPGLPTFTIVGLPDASIQEARERVRAAVQASREEWPMQRITVNLSPAHLRKAGSGFDLAIALGIMVARDRIEQERLRKVCVLGELSLDGTVRRIRGVLSAAFAAAYAGARTLLVPAGNAREAALMHDIEVVPIEHLSQAVGFFRDECSIEPVAPTRDAATRDPVDVDLSDVRGQASAKVALEVAAAGGHNLLMIGPPGGGKTMLARRLPTILPALSDEEAFEVTRVHSVAGLLGDDAGFIRARPFRAPHHSASSTGLIGGGSGLPHPGEISLAHRGVLFLDEFGEFRNEVLQSLRQPLEDGVVTIVRARWAVTYPARFQLVAGSNPCPCGGARDDRGECVCSTQRVRQYLERLTGPVIDRIDIQIRVPRIEKEDLFAAERGEASATVRARVEQARAIQRARWARKGFGSNAEMPARDIEVLARLTRDARARVEGAVDEQKLSARGAHRVIRLARTIADMEGADEVDMLHVSEAIGLRVPDPTL